MVEWFDDLEIGMCFKSGGKLVTREDIKRFAAEFDPQPYHLDEAAAERSVMGGLAASGWHTAAIVMRLCIETRPFGPHPIFGLGVDELRWLAPVRPGDADAVADEAAGRRAPQMDRLQPARRAGLYHHADGHRAAPPRLLGNDIRSSGSALLVTPAEAGVHR